MSLSFCPRQDVPQKNDHRHFFFRTFVKCLEKMSLENKAASAEKKDAAAENKEEEDGGYLLVGKREYINAPECNFVWTWHDPYTEFATELDLQLVLHWLESQALQLRRGQKIKPLPGITPLYLCDWLCGTGVLNCHFCLLHTRDPCCLIQWSDAWVIFFGVAKNEFGAYF